MKAFHNDARANCRNMPNNIFFPESENETDEAKKICDRCVIQEDCLNYALTTHQQYGVWGGATERERRSIHRQRRYAKKVKQNLGNIAVEGS